MGDFWADIQTFGSSAYESLGEGVSKITDAYVNAEVQKVNAVAANPQVQKEAEPIKGKNVQGQPIVVAGTGAQNRSSMMFDTKTLLLMGGGLVALFAGIWLVKK
jgi:hypothetical protein